MTDSTPHPELEITPAGQTPASRPQAGKQSHRKLWGCLGLLIAGCLVVTGLAVSAVWRQSASVMLQMAAALAGTSGNLDAKQDYLEKAATVDPQSDTAQLRLCELDFQRDKYQRALDDCRKAAKYENLYTQVRAYTILGHSQFILEDLDQAVVEYTAACERDLTAGEAFYWRGEAYVRLGEDALAVNDFYAAIRLNFNTANAYDSLGWAWIQRGGNVHAVGAFTKLVDLEPETVRGYLGRGVAFSNGGSQTEALVDFQKAVKIDPENSYIYYYRGIAYQRRGDKMQATRDLEKYLEMDPHAEFRGLARCHLQEVYTGAEFDSICSKEQEGW